MDMDPGVPYSRQHPSSHRRTFSDAPSPALHSVTHNMSIQASAQMPPGFNGIHNGTNGGEFGGQMQRGNVQENGSNAQLSRSPPAQKQNTSHVVCKFFRVGNCQAGTACPFSHILEDTMAPCKYFGKGNCKFGPKCANVHLLPDGRDARKVQMRGQYGGGFGYHKQYNQGANQGMYSTGYPNQSAYQNPAPMQEEYFPTSRQLENLPMIEGPYPNQAYGSPREDSQFALSPPVRAVDTAFPASFDDRAIPLHAREGQIAASAPKRFGFEPLSVPSATTSTITSNAFGNLSYLTAGNTQNNNRLSFLGSSPSAIEDAFPRRILHSDLRPASGMYASSFQGPFLLAPSPPPAEDSSDERSSEELTRVPGALDDLLTPREKVRRFSRPAADNDGGLRPRSFSGFGSPGANSPVGSPSNASPSSRYGALFARRARGEDTNNELGTSAPGASAFGHVGSPLRKSSLQSDLLSTSNSKPSLIGRTRSGNEQPSFSPSLSPITRPSGLGMLSQQLRASRLSSGLNVSDGATNGEYLHPNTGGVPTLNGLGSQKLDRTISTSSMGRSVGDRIDEEEEAGTDDGLFEMDDEGRERDRKVKDSAQASLQYVQNTAKQPDKERSGHSSQEITPTATDGGSQEAITTASASTKGPQPTQSRWTGGGAWNIVAAAGNKIGLTSAKPAETSQPTRPAGFASNTAKAK